jgi:hypothetical protein
VLFVEFWAQLPILYDIFGHIGGKGGPGQWRRAAGVCVGGGG